MTLILFTLVAALLGLLAWIRLAPGDPARWHVDPLSVETPVPVGHFLIRPVGGDSQGPDFAMPPEELLAAFDNVARSQPRVTVLAGSVADGMITYVARSRWFGFPDYVSVRALPDGQGGSRLALFARQRFGRADMGVNRARTEAWLERMPGTSSQR
ncbi:MAG: DUF1499 domain-containing protein [Rhodobacteraceae bacterium]|nr:DUF1499 domain-containing protein [Paracoccaceae bacterium]